MSALFPSEAEIQTMRERASKSANMAFYVQVLPRLIASDNGAYFYYGFGDESAMRVIIKTLADYLDNQKGIEGVDNIRKASIHFRLDPARQIRSTILEIPGASFEPECNFIAIVYAPEEGGGKKLRYLSSELYEDGSFILCEKVADRHVNYGHNYGDIRSVDDMWDAILKIIPETSIHPESLLGWHYHEEHHVTSLVDIRLDIPSSIERYLKQYDQEPSTYTGDNGVHYYMLHSNVPEGGFMLFRKGEDGRFISATLEDREIALSLGNKPVGA